MKSGDILYGIDLYLRDNDYRQLPVPFKLQEAGDLFDYCLCTHDHEDHLDEITVKGLASAGGKTQFIVPYPYVSLMESFGISRERVLGAKAWEKISLRGADLLPVPAAHEEFMYDDAGNHCFLGYVLCMEGGKLYHSGDTVEWQTMTEDLRPAAPDIACLPINGSDWKRKKKNIIGNLNAREAADIAEEIGADLLIPIHFDMFAGNGENPAFVTDYMFRDHPGRKCHVMAPGERFIYFRG